MSRPNWVQAAAVAEFEILIGALEAIAAGNAAAAAQMANFTLEIAIAPAISASTPAVTAPVVGWPAAAAALYAAIPWLVSGLTGVDPSLPMGCVALATGLVQAIAAPQAAAAFALAYDSTPTPAVPAFGTPNRIAAATNSAVITRFARMVYLGAYAEALVGVAYATRPEAITARADCVGRFEAELALCSGATDVEVAWSLEKTRDAVVAYLTQAIINSAPVLTVTAEMLPALVHAWRIYQDPARAQDLIQRNAAALAEFMPTQFEAAAPPNGL